jgi:hypothetical protein
VLSKRCTDTYKKRIEVIENEAQNFKTLMENEQRRSNEVFPHYFTLTAFTYFSIKFRHAFQELEARFVKKKTELRKAEENLSKVEREVERQASKVKASATGSQKEAELNEEVERWRVCFIN